MDDFAGGEVPQIGRSNSQSEASPLVSKKQNSCWTCTVARDICVHSKSALLILTWSLVVNIQFHLVLNPKVFMTYSNEAHFPPNSNIPLLVLGGVVMLFYPLAGYLGDVKCGKFKLVRGSLFLILLVITLEALAFILGYLLILKPMHHNIPRTRAEIIAFLSIVLLIACLLYVGLTGFTANVIQFGLDQLNELPIQYSSLFIHWYVWLYYVGLLTAQLMWAVSVNEFLPNHSSKVGISILVSFLGLVLLVLAVSLLIGLVKSNWFSVNISRQNNPYLLVYKATKYALSHKVPVRRSAFTYCEDEPPSRLDLGKEKFGGPFTTEQVEDVKVFYGILKVLISLGPVFFLEIPSSYLLQGFAQDWLHIGEGLKFTLLKILSLPLLAALFLLFYLCTLRRFIAHLIPSMLKRMGIGIFFALLSIVTTFIIYSVHDFTNFNDCEVFCSIDIFSFNLTNTSLSVPFTKQAMYIHTVQLVLPALSQLLIYIAMYEFICAQSPHHMKGLLIGLSFAIKGFFKSVSIVLITPFTYWHSTALSCESGYYLTNVVIACVSFGAFVWVAKRYKYRVRDEPERERQFAEEYYSKIVIDD